MPAGLATVSCDGEICAASDLLALLTITDSYITLTTLTKWFSSHYSAHSPTLYAPSTFYWWFAVSHFPMQARVAAAPGAF
jgi:hypothetical protein